MVVARVPSELSLDWVYFPPSLVMVVLGFLATWLLTRVFNRLGISQYFWYPELAFVGLWVMLTSLIGLFVIYP